MLLLLSLIAVCAAKLDLTVRLPLEQAEKLDGEDLITYLRNQNLFQVKESKEADERMEYLMDPKYLVSPSAEERVELDIGDEPIPEELVFHDVPATKTVFIQKAFLVLRQECKQ
ncbi:unnamed protein product [Cylicostephanus goldi]|uniref:Uncharacterized protein n=1 Tax=Cylicostephanus goldi TaxID=71465 RepID=A0A3P6RF02_CYLGO|nr:unnamed protein product [Cylicostephanus goldi]